MSMTDSAANVALCNESLGLLGAETIVVGGTSVNHGHCTTFFDASRDEMLVNHIWNWASLTAFAIETTVLLPGYDNAFTIPTGCLRVLKIVDDAKAKWKRRGDVIVTNEGYAPPDWAASTDYLAGQFISVTPATWATGTAYKDGQYVTDGTLIYEVLVNHTSDTIAADIVSLDLGAGVTGSTVTYEVDTTHTSTTIVADIVLTYISASGVDLKVLDLEYIDQVTDVSTYPEFMRQCFVLNLAIRLSSPIIQSLTSQVFLNLQTSLFGGPKTWGYLNIAKAIDAQEAGDEPIKTTTFLNARRTGRR